MYVQVIGCKKSILMNPINPLKIYNFVIKFEICLFGLPAMYSVQNEMITGSVTAASRQHRLLELFVKVYIRLSLNQ